MVELDATTGSMAMRSAATAPVTRLVGSLTISMTGFALVAMLFTTTVWQVAVLWVIVRSLFIFHPAIDAIP